MTGRKTRSALEIEALVGLTVAVTTSTSGPRFVGLLGAIMAWNVVSTTLHYTHNFLMAEDYPPVSPFFPNATAYRVGIAVFWPLLTALGIWAFRRYRSGRFRGVASALIAYAMLGFTSPGHFFGGVPDIPPFFMATIFTDFLGGAALLAFAAHLIVGGRRVRTQGAVSA
ncbi:MULTISPECIES: hypothetical protein [Nocardiaceae]|uniref:Uncharacterized protein n=1 Tax=Rhodococcoides kroppenstedtii TaxID=293050 RepID=A0ABS7NNP4_9NOCA|nr:MULTISPECIES: hypothetical protein [Rhodococcus]MBY6312310.1 hypothetical protein [Rhodococcus kroppenstedtii]MBY6319606.1 hypothetical protein [Rhodococcus kroppenstedtii]MBY6398289.1 hypothetical protein [Rhodococcus kroppenstedtii]MBY6438614.1 hypothetical protein [Rhodococcus kroppenstedtii]